MANVKDDEYETLDFADESEPVTDEGIYETLQSYERVGMLTFVVPSEPLGEEWVIGVDNDPGIVKLIGKGQAYAFLAGIATVARYMARQKRVL